MTQLIEHFTVHKTHPIYHKTEIVSNEVEFIQFETNALVVEHHLGRYLIRVATITRTMRSSCFPRAFAWRTKLTMPYKTAAFHRPGRSHA